MGDTLYSKQSHSNGPRVGLFDIPGTSTDTQGGNFFGGPYAEKVHQVPDDGNGNSLVLIEGWDPVGLVARKVKVDSNGQVYIANPGGGGTGGGGGEVTSSNASNFLATVFQGTASNLNATVVGTVTALPNGTQAVSGTVTSVLSGTAAVTQVTSPWIVSGTTVVTPSGTQNVKVIGDVTSGTAANFLVTSTPSGTQTVAGTVGATQVTSPWVISGTVVPNGTVTIIPSGTQTIVGTVTTTPSGTQTVTPGLTPDRIVTTTMTSTANIATISGQGAGVLLMNITGTWTGTMSFQATIDGSNWLAVSPPAMVPAGVGTITTTANGQWRFLVAGWNSFRINPTTFSSGTAVVVLEASQANLAVVVENPASNISLLNATVAGTVTSVPSGTQTVSGTVTSLLSGTAAVTQSTSPWVVGGTTTSVPSGTQVVSGTVAATQSTSPWVVSQGTASNLKALVNIGSTFNTGQVTVGTATGTTILASNTARIKLTLINTGTNAAYIGTATTVASTSGQLLAGIIGYPMATRSTSAVCGIASASTVTITYLEEVI